MTRRPFVSAVVAASVLVCAVRAAAVTTAELPLSLGPYETAPVGLRILEQDRRRFVAPPPAADPQEELGVRVGADAHWPSLAAAILTSLSGAERWLLVFVRDPAGIEHVVRVSLNARLMEPFFFPDGPALTGTEDVLQIRPKGRILGVEHEGLRLESAEIVTALDATLSDVGALFFPSYETPTRTEFPVWIESQGGGIRLQDVVELVSLLQRGGYASTLIDLF